MRQVEGEGFMFNAVVEEGLTYGQAMDKLIHEGQKVTRSIWQGYWYVPEAIEVTDPITLDVAELNPTIIAVLRNNGGYTTATPYGEDKFATDWMVVR